MCKYLASTIFMIFLSQSVLAQNNKFIKPDLPDPPSHLENINFKPYLGEQTMSTENGPYATQIMYQAPAGTQLSYVGSKNEKTGMREVKINAPNFMSKKYMNFAEGTFLVEDRYLEGISDSAEGSSSRSNSGTEPRAGAKSQQQRSQKPRLTANARIIKEVKIQNRNLIKEPTESEYCITCSVKSAPKKKNSLALFAKMAKYEAVRGKVLTDKSVPKKAFENAWKFFKSNIDNVRNNKNLIVIDYNLPSNVPRLFVVNLQTGDVKKHMVAHGKNSSGDPPDELYATKYSNTPGTKKSSYGGFISGERYLGKYGYSMRMDGAQKTNSNARDRYIVVHPWNVEEKSGKKYADDTWGCFGLDPEISSNIINKGSNGAAWYVEPLAGAV